MNVIPEMGPLRRRSGQAETDGTPFVLDPARLTESRIFGFGQMSEHAHPFFMIRAALLGHATSSSQRIFAITSAEPGNGKTHVAANLAAVLSRVHPTILLDLDLRQPSLGTRLGLPEDPPGIDDHLAGEAGWNDSGTVIDGFDLVVHRVRRARVNAEALLSSPALAQAIGRIRAEEGGPICIIDTPPALISDDLALIARCVDGVVLVAEEARSRKRGVIDVVNAISPTPVVGSILNMSISHPARQADYGYYQDRRAGGR